MLALGPQTACEYARQARLRATGCRCGERNRVGLPEALLFGRGMSWTCMCPWKRLQRERAALETQPL